MNIYEYAPPRKNKKATGVVILLFSFAIGLILFTSLVKVPFAWAFQLTSIIALTVAIFTVTRYLTKGFLYSINQNNSDQLDLDIMEITNGGRRQITVCRVAVRGISEGYVINKTDKSSIELEQSLIKKAKQEKAKIFNYCPDINPVIYSIIVGEECGEKFLIKFTPDDKLCEYLNIN